MARLTKEDVKHLDENIDETVGRERLLELPRDVALMNLLRYFEDYCRLFALQRRDFADGAALMKAGQDAMQFAVKWIYEYCPAPTRSDKFALDFDAYEASMKLHEAAMRYSTVWDFMAQLHRGAVIGERHAHNNIYLTYEHQDVTALQICRPAKSKP